ncbi:MAG: CAP domain-containing protein [Spirochaetales bacterium]|nr:CAP domain-containing protein [Spirochaetales bacterium]
MFPVLPLFSLDEETIGQWINDVRVEQGLNRLMLEDSLVQCSDFYAGELRERGFLSHRDEREGGPLERYKRAGGTALAVGEILGTTSSDAPESELLEAWWESSSHRAQIINPKWTCMGISLDVREGVIIAVVEFSSSLLTEYRFVGGEEKVLFLFKALPDQDHLEFSFPLEDRLLLWERGEEGMLEFSVNDFPLLMEVEVHEGRVNQKRGNRFLLTLPPVEH